MKGRLRLNFFLVVGLLVAIWTTAYDNSMGHDDEWEDAKDESAVEEEDPTDHQSALSETFVDFTSVDLSGDASSAAKQAMETLLNQMLSQGRLEELFSKTETPECRALIAEHFGYHIMSLAKEKPLPFVEVEFESTCKDEEPWDFNNLPKGVHMGIIQNRTYQPERNQTNEHLFISPFDVKICYGIMAHDSAAATIRLIEAVDESTTQFIVHIDSKYDDTYQQMKEYSMRRDRVVVLDHPNRVRVNWGGFSMVNATVQILNYAYDHDLDFTHFIHMASTAYPIASNRRIRNTLASYPIDANFLHVILKPNRPEGAIWNYFVECDDRLHRIHRLPPITVETHGADFYTSSQWFILSKEFANFLAYPDHQPPNSFLRQYWDYIQHVVVADESFFGTVLRNTEYCNKHHNWNFLHLQFDQWENEVDLERRDKRKCVMPDPNHCGRSPTTITLDHLDILEMSGDLFARKFLDDVDSKVKDVIDTLRKKEEMELVALNDVRPKREGIPPKVDMSLEGLGTLIVAKETVNSSYPLCLGLGRTGNQVRLVPCFQDWVIPTLAVGWETGGVIFEEVLNHTRWSIHSCSSDGNMKRLDSGEVQVIPGLHTSGPRCTFTMMDGLRAERCLDGEALDRQPGGPVHVFPCTKRWNQFLSFGNGKEVRSGAIYTRLPSHTQKRVEETGRQQEKFMCLGVAFRGSADEEDWFNERQDFFDSYDEEHKLNAINLTADREYRPLVYWLGEQLMSTKCSNEGAVIEWLLVPFIEEDDVPVVVESTTNPTSFPSVAQTSMSNEVEEL